MKERIRKREIKRVRERTSEVERFKKLEEDKITEHAK